MFTGGHRLRQLGSKLLAVLALFCATLSAFGASAPIATSIIPPGATYANISGSVAYQLTVTPGTTYFGIVTNATGFIEDNNFVNYVTGGQGILFVAPAGSQQGGANPLFALGGAGTVVGGAVQEQVYAVTTVANITASNLVALKTFNPAGLVSTPMVFGFNTSNQVALGSSGTNGWVFQNGSDIEAILLGSPVLRITNDVSHVGVAMLCLDYATVLAWGINGQNLGPEIFWNPSHSGDPEFIATSGNSMSVLPGQGHQGKSVFQEGSGASNHEIFYFVADGFPGVADITGEGWAINGSTNLIPSKSVMFQSGYLSNSSAFFPQITLRSESSSGTNGVTELWAWQSTQALRATNSSTPGTRIWGEGFDSSGNVYATGKGILTNAGNVVVTGGNVYVGQGNNERLYMSNSLGSLSFAVTNAAPTAGQIGANGAGAMIWLSNTVLFISYATNSSVTTTPFVVRPN